MAWIDLITFACLGAMLLIVLRSMNTQFRRLNKRLDNMDSWLLIRAKKSDERLDRLEGKLDAWTGDVDDIIKEVDDRIEKGVPPT